MLGVFPMKIWFVNHYAEPPDGMATRPFEIAKRLVESGYDVTIFASNFGHYMLRYVVPFSWRGYREEIIEGVRFVWVDTTPYRGNGPRRIINMVVFALVSFVVGAMRRERPDVVVGVTTHPLAGLTGLLLARQKSARFFYEVTDLWPQTLIEFGRIRAHSLTARGLRALERFLYDRAERIVMLWRDTQPYVASTGADPSKVVWIPHGVELDRYADLPPAAESPDTFIVMFLGGFNSANCLGTLIEAAAILQSRGRTNIEIDLVGAGIERNYWIDASNRRQLRNVRFPPPVPKTELTSVMRRADCFVYGLQDLPLYGYGITLNKLFDYLASHRPIVFYGRSSYDPVREERAGLAVGPNDPAALADAIISMADMPASQRRQMGENGYSFLLKHHLIPVLADRYRQIFEVTHGDATV